MQAKYTERHSCQAVLLNNLEVALKAFIDKVSGDGRRQISSRTRSYLLKAYATFLPLNEEPLAALEQVIDISNF